MLTVFILIGAVFAGPTIGLCIIELIEQSRGKYGPVTTALSDRNRGLVFTTLVGMTVIWMFSVLAELYTLLYS